MQPKQSNEYSYIHKIYIYEMQPEQEQVVTILALHELIDLHISIVCPHLRQPWFLMIFTHFIDY